MTNKDPQIPSRGLPAAIGAMESGAPARLKPLVRAAALNGNLTLLAQYVDSGGCIDARDRQGRTPLLLAASRGHLDLCRFLVQRGADRMARDHDGLLPIELLQERERATDLGFLSDPQPPGAARDPLIRPAEAPAQDLFGEWFAEDEVDVPAEDASVRDHVLATQDVLHARRPPDLDAALTDLVIDLPDADNLEISNVLRRDDVLELLVALIGEARDRGAYRPSAVEALAREIDGSPDAETRQQVIQLLSELATIPEEDESGWGHGRPVGMPWASEGDIDDCVQYLADLRSQTNDPHAHLTKFVAGSVLLDREGEERIGRMISLAIQEASRAIGSDLRARLALEELRDQVLAKPSLSTKFSRIEETVEPIDETEDEDRDGNQDLTEAAAANRSPSRLFLLIDEAILAFDQTGGSQAAIDKLELTVAGIRAVHHGMLAAGYDNSLLRKAVERATFLEGVMFTANVRLAVSVASRYAWSKLERMDLLQEAFIGLMKAIERFDFRRGYKFSTYATWWLRQSVSRAIADTERTIRIPVHVYDRVNKLISLARARGLDSPRALSAPELSSLTGLSEREVRKALSTLDDASLWEDAAEDAKSIMAIADPGETPMAYAVRTEMERIVRESLDELTSREADVIKHRFGLDTEEKTLEEIGQLYDVTRERIRQIEAKALGRLRHPVRRIAILEDYTPECG